MRRVCVFCGSSTGVREDYVLAARMMGTTLARRGLGLVYGGGQVGLMGVVADAALAAGGEVIGVIPQALASREIAHQGLADLRVVASMHERKALMADLADAFVAMPGGFGTWDEICEVITWSQLGLHRKPCGLLNVAGYYDPLLAMAAHAVAEGFVHSEHLESVMADIDPEQLLDRLATYVPRFTVKWISRAES